MAETKPKRTEAPQVRRAQILDAAKRCFREAGFHGTKMAEIAAAAGISVGLVYRLFPNKDAVIEAIILQDIDQQKQQFADALDAHPDDPLAAIEAMATGLAPAVLDHDRTALLLEIAAETVRNPAIRASAARAHDQVVEMVRGRLEALNPLGMSVEEIEVRLQLLAGLVGGVAIQLYKRTHTPSPLMFDLLEATAKQIIAPSKARATRTTRPNRPRRSAAETSRAGA
jgi:AcrR family transcriptional regulator